MGVPMSPATRRPAALLAGRWDIDCYTDQSGGMAASARAVRSQCGRHTCHPYQPITIHDKLAAQLPGHGGPIVLHAVVEQPLPTIGAVWRH